MGADGDNDGSDYDGGDLMMLVIKVWFLSEVEHESSSKLQS